MFIIVIIIKSTFYICVLCLSVCVCVWTRTYCQTQIMCLSGCVKRKECRTSRHSVFDEIFGSNDRCTKRVWWHAHWERRMHWRSFFTFAFNGAFQNLWPTLLHCIATVVVLNKHPKCINCVVKIDCTECCNWCTKWTANTMHRTRTIKPRTVTAVCRLHYYDTCFFLVLSNENECHLNFIVIYLYKYTKKKNKQKVISFVSKPYFPLDLFLHSPDDMPYNYFILLYTFRNQYI